MEGKVVRWLIHIIMDEKVVRCVHAVSQIRKLRAVDALYGLKFRKNFVIVVSDSRHVCEPAMGDGVTGTPCRDCGERHSDELHTTF